MQKNLMMLRGRFGFSQKFVSEMLNLSEIEYGKKERGVYPFTSYEMFKLSELFKKPINDVFLPRGNQIGDKSAVTQ